MFGLGDQKAAYAEFQLAAEADKKALPAELAMAMLFTDKANAEKWLEFSIEKGGQDCDAVRRGKLFAEKQPGRRGSETCRPGTQARSRGAGNQFGRGHDCTRRATTNRQSAFVEIASAGSRKRADHQQPGWSWWNSAIGRTSNAALQFAELNARQNPNATEVLSTLGWVNYRLNRRVDAMRALARCSTRATSSRTTSSLMRWATSWPTSPRTRAASPRPSNCSPNPQHRPAVCLS